MHEVGPGVATLPGCMASCNISFFCALQLISVLVQSISALVGSEVTVTITSVRSGSVVVATSVLFLSGNSNDATTYVSTLTSSSFVSLYGSNFGAVAVDTGSVTITSASSGGDAQAPCMHVAVN